MNVQEINTSILSGSFTNDQLSSIIDAVKFARALLAKETKRGLRIGDNVNFTASKTGRNYTGVVMKVAIKFVTVRTITGLWKVPANMLQKVEDREFA